MIDVLNNYIDNLKELTSQCEQLKELLKDSELQSQLAQLNNHNSLSNVAHKKIKRLICSNISEITERIKTIQHSLEMIKQHIHAKNKQSEPELLNFLDALYKNLVQLDFYTENHPMPSNYKILQFNPSISEIEHDK